MIRDNCYLSTQEIAEHFVIHHSMAEACSKYVGMVEKVDVWVPHGMTARNLFQLIDTCHLLLKRYTKKESEAHASWLPWLS